MTESALVVPIRVDALAVDQTVLARDDFRLWPFAYPALGRFASPEPDVGDRNTGSGQAGVQLHWTLPDALRHGTQTAAGVAPQYPPVPNRWLVARFTGQQPRAVTAWVIEADCPYSAHAHDQGFDDTRCSLYLVDPDLIGAWKSSADPFRNTVDLDPQAISPQVANIGLAFPAAGWTERAARPAFLTAVAPGNAAFSGFVPHHGNVFAFYDDLAGVDRDTVSYALVGWYSDPGQDIAASATPAALNWCVTGSGTPARSVYHGLVLSMPWHRDGNYPAGTAPDDPLHDIRASGPRVGIGNTAEDAFLALVRSELTARQYDPSGLVALLPLLRALLYGVLPMLNETAGDVKALRRIAGLWFGTEQGGYGWTVTPPPATGGTPAPFTPPAWLPRLNADQARLDAELGVLYSLQWSFNAMWLKYKRLPFVSFPSPPDGAPTEEQMAAQLDPTAPGSLAARLVAQLRTVLSLVDLVPQPVPGPGTAQDAFERGIAAFAAAKGGLAPGATLKAVSAPPYRRPGNPVVAISGVTPPALSQHGEALPVRTSQALITALTVAGTAIEARGMPAVPSLAAMPEVVAPLLAEYYLLDPASAAALAGASGVPEAAVRAAIEAHAASSYQGTLPAVDLSTWHRQPWEPLFFEWSVQYQPVPPAAGGTQGPAPWLFDGDDYRLGPVEATAATRGIGAISLLSQHAPVVFRDRLATFVKQHGDETALAQLGAWLDAVDGWQVLSQELTGLDDLLALRDHRAFRRPTVADQVGPPAAPLSVADLAGYTGAGSGPGSLPGRYRGQVTSWPYLPTGPTLPFAGVRAGQFYFTQVLLYDCFGRVLHVVEPEADAGLYQAQNFPVDIDPALAPDTSLAPAIRSVMQVPPRLTQGARLDLTLLDAATGTPFTDGDPKANPMGGWLLSNHLDASLLLFAADGTSLGSFRLYETSAGARAGAWSPPAHSAVTTLAQVAAKAPLVASVITAPELAVEANFTAFMSAIDVALWTIDPAGARADQSLAVLVGRPLALVPLRLTLALDGAARTDPGWPTTIDPPPPELLSVAFPVRLGDQATRDDGLVGYFAGGDFAALNTVAAPASAAPYLRQIGPPGGGGNYVTLRPAPPGTTDRSADVVALLDPRAAVHATAGIVPATSVRVPSRFVGPALSGVEIQITVPTALTARQPTPAPAGTTPAFPQAVTVPVPGGQWSWWEPDGAGGWLGSAVLGATADANITGAAPVVIDGVLQLIADLASRIGGPDA